MRYLHANNNTMKAKNRLVYERPLVCAYRFQAEGVICESIEMKFGMSNESGVIDQENIIDGGIF